LVNNAGYGHLIVLGMIMPISYSLC